MLQVCHEGGRERKRAKVKRGFWPWGGKAESLHPGEMSWRITHPWESPCVPTKGHWTSSQQGTSVQLCPSQTEHTNLNAFPVYPPSNHAPGAPGRHTHR